MTTFYKSVGSKALFIAGKLCFNPFCCCGPNDNPACDGTGEPGFQSLYPIQRILKNMWLVFGDTGPGTHDFGFPPWDGTCQMMTDCSGFNPTLPGFISGTPCCEFFNNSTIEADQLDIAAFNIDCNRNLDLYGTDGLGDPTHATYPCACNKAGGGVTIFVGFVKTFDIDGNPHPDPSKGWEVDIGWNCPVPGFTSSPAIAAKTVFRSDPLTEVSGVYQSRGSFTLSTFSENSSSNLCTLPRTIKLLVDQTS